MIGLEGGTKFPREFEGGSQAGIGTTQFGPIEIPSPIKEDPKFMEVGEIRQLYNHPEKSRRIQAIISDFVRHEQTSKYLKMIGEDLREKRAVVLVEGPRGDEPGNSVLLKLAGTIPADRVFLIPPNSPEEVFVYGDPDDARGEAVTFERTGPEATVQTAKQMRIRARPDIANHQIHVTVELIGRTPLGGGRPVSANYSDVVNVKMPPDLAKLRLRKMADYPRSRAATPVLYDELHVTHGDLDRLDREGIVLRNLLLAEATAAAASR